MTPSVYNDIVFTDSLERELAARTFDINAKTVNVSKVISGFITMTLSGILFIADVLREVDLTIEESNKNLAGLDLISI